LQRAKKLKKISSQFFTPVFVTFRLKHFPLLFPSLSGLNKTATKMLQQKVLLAFTRACKNKKKRENNFLCCEAG
jgi:hypothetical protein